MVAWLNLEDSRDYLSCCCICAKGCNEAKHCSPTVKLFCFRSHGKNEIWIKYKEELAIPWVFTHGIRLWELIVPIRKVYLIIEIICAECNLSSRSFFLAKWLFKLEELVLHLEARFNSDWCIAFLFDFWLTKYLIRLNLNDLVWRKETAQRCGVRFSCKGFFWLKEGDSSRFSVEVTPFPVT